MTTALIVVESCFGATRTAAEAVASGLGEAGVQTQVVDVAQAPGSLPAGLDLLVLGAPTHNRGLPTPATRAQAHKKTGTTAPSTGMREWLARTVVPASTPTAVFDTVTSRTWLSGSAARAICKSLRRGQARRTDSPRSFLVRDNQGPLADGETEAARGWGRTLAAVSSCPSSRVAW